MIEHLEESLGRKLTEQEHKVITWLQGWESETQVTIAELFVAMWMAGFEEGKRKS